MIYVVVTAHIAWKILNLAIIQVYVYFPLKLCTEKQMNSTAICVGSILKGASLNQRAAYNYFTTFASCLFAIELTLSYIDMYSMHLLSKIQIKTS